MTDKNILNLIRTEMSVYDEKTGMNAKEIPITLITSPNIMGQYSHAIPQFKFNRLLFNETEPIMVESNLISMIIKHEYTHYLSNTLYNQNSHGQWFEYCAKLIDYEPNAKEYGIVRDLTNRKWNKLKEIEVKKFIFEILPQTLKQDDLYYVCCNNQLQTMLDLVFRDSSDLEKIFFESGNIASGTISMFITTLNMFKSNFSKKIAL